VSKQKLENMRLNSFLKSTPQQQQIFLKEINISELTTKEDYPLL